LSSEKKPEPLGVHMLVDVVEAPFTMLDDPLRIKGALLESVRELGSRILSTNVHHLHPQGVTGVAVISESHLSIHTWPERGEAAVDLFSCGDPERARAALRVVTRRLGGRVLAVKEIVRGHAAD
jgi:S-adenosylmethionine decarboxylase